MKGDFDGELMRRMEEASLLPSDHPKRREVREEVASVGGWAEKEWLRLQAEPERLRGLLLDVTAPAGLEQRLLDIPSNMARRLQRLRWPFGAAAALLVIAAVVVVMSVQPVGDSTDQSLVRIATLVAADHMERPELTIAGDDRQRLVSALQARAPFEVRLPSPTANGSLLGGRICRFDEGPLVLTRWRRGDHDISMYQIRLTDFGLPPNLSRHEIEPPDQGSAAGLCRVQLWSDDRFVYATVTDAAWPDDDS